MVDYDAVVIGAGASGLWAARELAPDHDVLVLEAGDVGAGASGHAAGFVSVFEDWAPFPGAVERALSGFRDLDGVDEFDFEERPYLELAGSESEAERLREAYADLIGSEVAGMSYLDADELRSRWPGRFDLSGFVGGLVKEGGGIIDPMAYVRAIAADARDRGVEIRTQTPVEGIATAGPGTDGGLDGVEIEGGTVEAETVVCAAGAQTDRLVEPFLDLPTRQFVYSNVRVETDGPLPETYPMVYADEVWWRPEPRIPETLMVSGGMYFLPERDRPPRSPPREYLSEVREKLPRMATDVSEVRFVTGSDHTCPKGTSVTPDGLPVIDAPDGAPDGLIVVAAVTGGISMAPFTGAAVRSLVTGEEAPAPLAPFALSRFDDPPADFRVHGIRDMPDAFPTGTY